MAPSPPRESPEVTGVGKLEVISKIFIDRTDDGALAEEIRVAELEMASVTGYRVKVIEKNGCKLENILVRRDRYVGWDCRRSECQCCKVKPARNRKDNCNKQSLVYTARCEVCMLDQEKLQQQIDEMEEGVEKE